MTILRLNFMGKPLSEKKSMTDSLEVPRGKDEIEPLNAS